MNKYSENLGRKKANQFNNSLILKDVSFSYSRNWILKNINLKISKNETVAIVGESGSGKSTLMNLLTGLIFPSKGSYFVDQSSIEEIDLYSFRNHIGYIPQDPVMFNDTIFNNITLWGEKTPEIIRRFQYALKKASIFEFIYELEFKEETILGHNGISLSGGQKQRLCLAREIFKEVDILFLDEATSSLDSETEIEIKDHIEGLKGKITLIIIAHRLSTIKFADRIILLNKGRIELEGTYENLIKDSEHFRRMVELQNV